MRRPTRQRKCAPEARDTRLVLEVRWTRNRKLQRETVSLGSTEELLVHPREAFGGAVRAGARSVRFVRSGGEGDGEPAPQAGEWGLIRRLEQVGRMIGVAVRDYVILAGRERWSASSIHYLHDGDYQTERGASLVESRTFYGLCLWPRCHECARAECRLPGSPNVVGGYARSKSK